MWWVSNRLYSQKKTVRFPTGSGSLTGLAVPAGCCHCPGYMAGASPHSLRLTWTRQPSHVRLCLRSPCVVADWSWRHGCIIPAVELVWGLAADTRETVHSGSGWPSFPGKEPSWPTWGRGERNLTLSRRVYRPLGLWYLFRNLFEARFLWRPSVYLLSDNTTSYLKWWLIALSTTTFDVR